MKTEFPHKSTAHYSEKVKEFRDKKQGQIMADTGKLPRKEDVIGLILEEHIELLKEVEELKKKKGD